MAATDAQKRATIKYMKENLDQIVLRVPKGEKERIRAFAEHKGLAMTAYIKQLIEKDMETPDE